MKQQVFIIIGAVIVLLLVAVWAYLLFFGTPETADDVFAELGLSGSEDTFVVPPPIVVEETPTVNMERSKLRQLTTKPVIGFKEIATATNTVPSLYYAEMGTGHIFSINLGSGEEVRISGTTVPKASHAEISSDGTVVAIASPTNSKNLNLSLGVLSTSTPTDMTLTSFTAQVSDFALTSDGELLFAEQGEANTVASVFDLDSLKERVLFTIPYRETRIEWGEESGDSHYAYPKASYALEGFLYEARGGSLTRLPVDGFGFTAKANENLIVYTALVNQIPTTYLYNRDTKQEQALNSYTLPEKCLLPETGLTIICAQEAVVAPYESPDTWYQGAISFKDTLYAIYAEDFAAELLADTFTETKREIDAIKLEVGESGGALYFINKNDNTLWMYEF